MKELDKYIHQYLIIPLGSKELPKSWVDNIKRMFTVNIIKSPTSFGDLYYLSDEFNFYGKRGQKHSNWFDTREDREMFFALHSVTLSEAALLSITILKEKADHWEARLLKGNNNIEFWTSIFSHVRKEIKNLEDSFKNG